jgi:hypothetical protein
VVLEETRWFGVAGTLVCDLTGFDERGLGLEGRASVAVGKAGFRRRFGGSVDGEADLVAAVRGSELIRRDLEERRRDLFSVELFSARWW